MKEKIGIGVLCPSEIAFRRFMPALQKVENFSYLGVAVADGYEWFGGEPDVAIRENERKKAERFKTEYGGTVYESYGKLLADPQVQAVYVPLPPALHFTWGSRVLASGKHLFMEKPFTDRLENTETLIRMAREAGLAVHENYMFIYHSQLTYIQKCISDGAIGKVRLYRMGFGFPRRAGTDFRYCRALGGGALLDCCGYPVRLAGMLLGESAHIQAAQMDYEPDCEVDIAGSVYMRNDEGMVAQIAYGMANEYRCELDVWGEKGSLIATRVFTAGIGVEPEVILRQDGGEKHVKLPECDQFMMAIRRFGACMEDRAVRQATMDAICRQGALIETIRQKGDRV